jgi:hypothetical protein
VIGQRYLHALRSWLDSPWDRHRHRLPDDEVARLRRLTVPMSAINIPMTPDTRRIAGLLERLPSVVLVYGYGSAEALVFALSIDAERVEPLVAALKSFSDEEISGLPGSDAHRMRVAVACRGDLQDAIREIVSAYPKAGVEEGRRQSSR